MKYLKTYEKLKSSDDYHQNMTYDDVPKVNDFVICNIKNADHDSEDTVEFKKFVNNNIGHIILVNNHRLITHYENIPNEISSYFTYNGGDSTHLYLHEIKYFSDKKEDLEVIINSKKYNL